LGPWQLEANNYLNTEWFKEFSFNLLEHISILLKQKQNFEELQVIFKFVFKEIPTYNEIVNRTTPIYPIFSLNSKKEPQINWSSSLNLLWQQTVYLVRNSIMDYEGLYRTWIEDRLGSK